MAKGEAENLHKIVGINTHNNFITMNKPRVILAAICLFAGIGGALAFKARATPGFIIVNGVRVAVTTQATCTPYDTGCLYQVPNAGIYQMFTTTAVNGPAVPLQLEN